MKRNNVIGIVVVALLFVGLAFYASHSRKALPSTSTELTKASVRMKWFFAGTMAGWFAGKEQGIFKKHGIDLSIMPGGPDNSAVKLVAAGSDTFGVAGADEVLQARAKGMPIVAIGVLFKESPVCFIAKKAKGITSPEQWAGKTVEVSYGSNAETEYRALISKFRPQNVKEVPYTFNLLPFIEDKVDVSVAYRMDQVVTLERQGIQLSVISPKDFGINPYGDVVITTERTLKERPELVRRFMSAVIASHTYAIENPEAAVSNLVANASSLTFNNELAVWKATIPFLVADGGKDSIGTMRNARWQDTMDVMLQFKSLTAPVKLENTFTNIPK